MSDAQRLDGTAGEPKLSVAMRTLGCKVNRVESEDIAADLLGRGAVLVAEEFADVIVINTCTVTGEADAKARKAVRQALAAESRPVVVVTGCLAAIDAAALSALDSRVVVEADKERVAASVADLLALPDRDTHPASGITRTGDAFRIRVQLKVQDGCDCFCTYCIVPHARGLPRSVALHTVAEKTRDLVASGVTEIVLTGINLGRYRDGDADLASVVETVAAQGVARLRLSSIEPLDIDDRLLSVLASTPAACAHLHVPLQSGSDRVLEAMGRGYTLDQFESRIAAARVAIPGLAVTTDVIAGFPGESEHDAAETLEAVERVGFSRLHVFRYSARAGTPAASMTEQVSPETKAARAAALRELDYRLRESFASERIGSSVEVLVERISDTIAEGTTRDYLKVRFGSGTELRQGDLVEVAVLGVEDGVLLGEGMR